MPYRRALSACFALLPLTLLGVACSHKSDDGAPGTTPTGKAAESRGAGPAVTIPGGSFRAGTPCGGVPRVTNEEVVGPSISLGDFTMDVYPYPNDPLQPSKVDVTRDEAEGLCKAQGKRLCTELEWERACKGPNGTTFEYGNAYDAAACKPESVPGKRPKCASGFGVKDLHGLPFEWTSSAWGRGTSGDLGTVRGGGTVTVLQARCANGQGRPIGSHTKDLGFRCCGGTPNSPAVDLPISHQSPMVEEPSVEASLGAAMLRAMPQDHRTQAGADVSFDKVWRWHPRDNEELLIGRWVGKPKDSSPPYYELAIFKVCSGAPSLISRFRGPVGEVKPPGAGADAQRASASVRTKDQTGDVTLSYSYGSVKVEEPTWLTAGSSLALGGATPVIKLPVKIQKPH